MEKTIVVHNCLKCGHGWASKLPLPPRRCPGCFSQNWTKPKRPPRPQSIRPELKNRAYHFHDLEVGQSVIEPWFPVIVATGGADSRNNAKINRAVLTYAYRVGRQYKTQGTAHGLEITRIV